MLELEISGKVYTGPSGWDEVTLEQYIQLTKVEIPEKLRALWVASADGDDKTLQQASDAITYKELEKVFPAYFGSVFAVLTNIPEGVINTLAGPLREQFFNQYFRHYIFSMFTRYPLTIDHLTKVLDTYSPPIIQSFTLNNVTYMLPETLKVYGEEIALGREQVITFSEASDIEVAIRDMAEGAIERLPMFIAVYCRPKGEVYNEDTTIKRAELFRQLTMDKVWAVFFCILRLLNKYQNFIQTSFVQLENSHKPYVKAG